MDADNTYPGLTSEQMSAFLLFQQNEINEYYIYKRLAKRIKDSNNASVLDRIGEEEKLHYETLKKYTQKEISPNWLKIRWYYYISRIFGITFGIKLMEKGEEKAQHAYARYVNDFPEVAGILADEDKHEHELIALLDEERLQYAGSIVLGLNDALVELTGALAGLSLAMQNTRLIAMAGMITGIAASFSMAASDYLSKKADDASKNAVKSATYTGLAYIFTVILLILPYLLFSNYLICLALTLSMAILIIFFFNYYISVAKNLNFKRRFAEMALISLGVSALTFGIGFLIRKGLGIEV